MDIRIIQYFAGELNQSQRITLLEELRYNETLKEEFAAYRNVEGLISFADYPDDPSNAKKSLDEFVYRQKRKKRRKILTTTLSYASVVLLIITGTWMFSYYYYHPQSTNDEIAYNEISIPAGQHSVIKLSDGTEVWMNARSSLRYPTAFGKKERKVTLRGEAYFKVTAQQEIPFIVSTSQLDIKVLGTSFNVREDADSAVDVSLLKGSVEVIPYANKSKTIRLKPMQNLNYKGNNLRLTQLHGEDDFLWREGILFFDKLSLAEIAQKIAWHYDTRIIIHDAEIEKHIYSGKFRQQDGPHEILRILQKSRQFSFKKDDVNNIFMLDRYRDK